MLNYFNEIDSSRVYDGSLRSDDIVHVRSGNSSCKINMSAYQRYLQATTPDSTSKIPTKLSSHVFIGRQVQDTKTLKTYEILEVHKIWDAGYFYAIKFIADGMTRILPFESINCIEKVNLNRISHFNSRFTVL